MRIALKNRNLYIYLDLLFKIPLDVVDNFSSFKIEITIYRVI